MWMHRLIVVVVVAVATLSAAALAADSGATATPVAVENGSSYEVGTVLEFDVPKEEGEYDLSIDGDWMATRAASEGTVVVDTSDRPAGSAALTDADSQERIFEIELVAGKEATPSPTATRTPSPTPTRTPADAATAQHDRAGTDSAASHGAGGTATTGTEPSSPSTTAPDETVPPTEGEPTGSTAQRPDRTTTTAPGLGPVAVLVAVGVVLAALRRVEP